ncbi:AsmA-like C-terminal region-containing protein [Xanthobacteraceae bacterium A53D]
MQAILIGLASAVILVIGAAFAAPHVVDWTQWRAHFEAEASRILGVPVAIRGKIDAEILPSPSIVLRDVTLGADPSATGASMRELRADLTLGALMRGEVEAGSVTLVRPALRVVLDPSGRLAPPPGTGRAAGFSIAQIAVEQGTLDLIDRGAGRTTRLSDLNLKGEVRSTLGPFRLDGEGMAAGERYQIRTTLGRMGEEGGRLRFIADGRSRPFSLDLDGTLRTASGIPQFEGKGSLVRRGEAGSISDAWRLSAAVRMSPEAVVADTLDLAMGEDIRPMQLSGSARLSLGRAVGLDAVLNARSLDLDALRVVPASGQQGPVDALSGLAATFAALPAPDVTSRIGIAVDQLTVSGTVVRDARADFTGQASGWRIDTAEAKLPGQSAVRLSGIPARTGGEAGFGGDLLFTSDDPAAFLRWAAPRAAPDYAAAVKGPVRIAGRLAAHEARYALTGLDAAFGPAKLRGDAALELPDNAAPKLDVKLAVEGTDLDPLLAAARKGLGQGTVPLAGRIALDGKALTLSGLSLRTLALDAVGDGKSWTLNRFNIDDLVGLTLSGTGEMQVAGAMPTGRLALSIAGPKADGLVPVSRLVAGTEAADVIQRLLPIAAPVQVSAATTWGADGARELMAEGTLGQLSGRAAFSRTGADAPNRVELALAATDGARALQAAGLGGLRPGQGPGRLDLAITPRADGTAAFDGRLMLAGSSASGQGSARFGTDGALQPTLEVKLDTPDLARLLASDLATDGAVPGSLNFALSRAGTLWRFEKLAGSLAGAPVSGALDLEPGQLPRVSGRLEVEALSVPRLMGLWSARSVGPDVGNGPWSAARFTAAVPAPAAVALDLSAKRIELGGHYTLSDGQMRLVSDNAALEVREVSGRLGSGNLNGAVTLRRRGDAIQADGRLTLEQVESGVLLAPLGVRAPPRGLVSLSLDAQGTGRTPQAIVQALSGQGTISVRDLEIPAADPKAIDSVMAETAAGQPPDERRILALFERALARGPLKLEGLEGTFGMVNGIARLSPARAAVGNTSIAVAGNLDLPRLMMDVTLDQEAHDTPGTMPGGVIAWRGPLAAPERRVTATALIGVISMRAIERETRRLEERQNAPAPTAPPPSAPPRAAPISVPAAPAPVAPPAPAAVAPPVVTPPAPPAAAAPSPAPAAPATAAPASPASVPAPAAAVPPAAPVQPAPPPYQPRPAVPSQAAAPPLPPPQEIGPVVRPQMEPPNAYNPYALPPPPSYNGFGILMRPPGMVPD